MMNSTRTKCIRSCMGRKPLSAGALYNTSQRPSEIRCGKAVPVRYLWPLSMMYAITPGRRWEVSSHREGHHKGIDCDPKALVDLGHPEQ